MRLLPCSYGVVGLVVAGKVMLMSDSDCGDGLNHPACC